MSDINDLKAAHEAATAAKTTTDRCPNCGYCPHCGRSNAPWYPAPYVVPMPYVYPRWIGPTYIGDFPPYGSWTITSGTSSTKAINAHAAYTVNS